MRQNIPAADEVLNLEFPVLDNGSITLIDYCGSDEMVERAARTSYADGTRQVSDTRTLVRYLMRQRHTSVFEFAELTFRVSAPIFVVRQWQRHRAANFAEMSGRYSVVKDCYYTPPIERIRSQSKDNKQGSSDQILYNSIGYNDFLDVRLNDEVFDEYGGRLTQGWSRELARIDLPLSTYTHFHFKADLHNLLHFLKLRTDSHAQEEIREYAHLIACFVKRAFPISFEAWVDYSYSAKLFTRLDIELLHHLQYIYQDFSINEWAQCYADDKNNWHEEIGMSKRELSEFFQKLIPISIPSFDLDLTKGKKHVRE